MQVMLYSMIEAHKSYSSLVHHSSLNKAPTVHRKRQTDRPLDLDPFSSLILDQDEDLDLLA